jgi:hypothetical protein
MNYRDLQNISNLSQEILIEGANEEHNVLNRWPYTSPYLQESTELDEGAAGDVAARAQKLANQKKEQTPERKKMYQDLAYKARSRERDGSGSPRTSRFERSKVHGPDITPMASQSRSSQETLGGGTYERGPKRLPKSKEKYRRQVATGVRAASSQEKKRLGVGEAVDLYDIILSHLLDEGYAETQEQAQVIMVNMSEDWRESICEAILEYQPFKDKRKRVKSKVKELESQKTKTPKDLGFRNARLQKRIDSMKNVLGKKNKEITSASQQKSYDSMAKGGFKHHDDPESKYYIK